MLKSAAGKVLLVGRTMVFLVGLAVILALIFGAASVALGATGNPFLLGKGNVASKVSALTNRGLGAALSLNVQPDQPPLAVNSSTRVEGLNADLLDGKSEDDFYAAGGKVDDADKLDGLDSGTLLRGPVYSRNTDYVRPGSAVVTCEAGDTLLGGGYAQVPPDNGSTIDVWGDQIVDNRYRLDWEYTGQEPFYGQVSANVTCADSDGDGPGEPVLVEGIPGQSQQNVPAERDLRNAAAAAERCAADNNGSYVTCTEPELVADYGFDQSDLVDTIVSAPTADTWAATAKHVDSPTVYSYSTADGVVRER